MNNDELSQLLVNKLNSLNSALASAMQNGSIEAVKQLKTEIEQVESELLVLAQSN